MLQAHIPRNLRVRSSIQLASARVPARAFLIVAGLIFVGGMAVVGGADLARTTQVTGALIVVGLALFEMRWWGRSTRQAARILARQFARSRRLRLEAATIALPPESSAPTTPRRPRWKVDPQQGSEKEGNDE